ncbi:MAG: AAA family ATPase [Euryarchaeota archaeon]|nr:AAA family ATPase [Euryarchaeota archaeon]
MKISIQNLGAINSADITIKPLTVFIGPPGTGKSWAAYTISGILGQNGWHEMQKSFSESNDYECFPSVKRVLDEILSEGRADINIAEFLKEYGEFYFNKVGESSRNWLDKFFATNYGNFKDFTIDIQFSDRDLNEKINNLKKTTAKGGISQKKTGESLLRVLKERNEDVLHFYTEYDEFPEEFPESVIKEFVLNRIFESVHRSIYSDIFYFPAERTGLITFFNPNSFREVKDSKEYLDSNSEEKRTELPIPIINFISLIANSLDVDIKNRINASDKIPEIKKYLEISSLLEKCILQGNINYEEADNFVKKELIYHYNSSKGNIDLDLPASSSLVKDLSILVLYLKFFSKENDLIIIDEPEINLHPKSQIQFIEILTMLVNAGINVIITTHSPYFVDHLVNLMKAKENLKPNKIKDLFYLKSKDAFIDKNDVSVYLFENNSVSDILDKEDGLINWGTFSEVSEEINELYDRI